MLLQGGILRGHLNLWEVLYSHPPKVHCPDTVIVRTIPAFTAAEQMPLLLAVPLFRMSTDRAGLRRICRVNIDHMATETFSFVLQFLFQVIIRPADRYVSVFQKYALRRGADAGKVLQDEQRPLWVSADECLRQAVVDIAHPTVFSLPDGTDPSSGGGGLPGLEFPAELLIMRPFLFHNSPGCKGSPLSIKRCGEESDAPVNNHYNCIRSQRNRVLHFGSHRDMQVELPVTADQFRGAKDNAICECPFECIGAERDPDPS